MFRIFCSIGHKDKKNPKRRIKNKTIISKDLLVLGTLKQCQMQDIKVFKNISFKYKLKDRHTVQNKHNI